MENIKKIFVLGRHRSGTTWLCNILASHEDIYSPLSKLHNGQHESAFFSGFFSYFNGCEIYNDMYALDVVFRQTDFFKLLDIGEEFKPDLNQGAGPYFSSLMDAAAIKNRCCAWVEKTPRHTYFIEELIACYPDAKLVAVERKLIDQVRSFYVGLEQKRSIYRLFRAAVVCEIYRKIIHSFSDHIYIIKYETMVNDYESAVRELFKYLELEISDIPESPFRPNSSFTKGGKEFSFGLFQRGVIFVAGVMMKIIPTGLISLIIKAKKKFGRKCLPRWSFYSSIYHEEL